MNEIRLRMKRFGAKLVLMTLAVSQLFVLFPIESAAAASATIVISEVQFGGAASADEFVELYNKTDAPIDLSSLGLRLHTKNSTPTNAHKPLTFVNPALTTIPAKGYFLIVNVAANASLLAQANATYTNSGPLVTDGATYISTSATADTDVIDAVGWNGQPVGGFEGTVFTSTPTFAATHSIERKPGGINGNATDTDNNLADFSLRLVPNPQNAGSSTQPSAPAAPVLATALPGDGQVTLTWTAVDGANDYVVVQDTVALAPFVVAPTVTKLVTGLTNGTTYAFQVKARNNFETESVASNTLLATPTAPAVVPGDPIPSTVVFREATFGTAGAHFGVTSIHAEVTLASEVTLVAGDNPTITFNRPGTTPVTLNLSLVAGKWVTTTPFVITPANSPQDGTVTISLATTTGKTFSITAGSSFTVDTKVSQPTVTVISRCSGSQDSFTATTDADVNQVFVYKSASVDLANLIAVAQVAGGTTSEIFIGDNAFGTLFVVAQDITGNRSAVVEVKNRIAAPAMPNLQLESSNGVIIATWAAVPDATSYVLRWKKVTDTTFTTRDVTTLKHELIADNGVEYEVGVASRDSACNQSAFASVKATPQALNSLATAGRGGIADTEAAIMAQSIAIAYEKDGEATKKSPYTLEEDSDQNGIKDADEDKNGNGIKDVDETPAPSPAPSSSVQDRSRLIVTLAILLIIAGTAIAAYSWYQGENTTPSTGDKKPAGDKTDATEATAPEEKTGEKRGKRGGRGKRKTRW